jgi:hypothetical protein
LGKVKLYLGVLQAVVCFSDYVLQHGLPLDGMHKKNIANHATGNIFRLWSFF